MREDQERRLCSTRLQRGAYITVCLPLLASPTISTPNPLCSQMESTHDRPGHCTVDDEQDARKEVQPIPLPPTSSYSSVQGLHPPPPTPISSSSSEPATALHPPRRYNPYPYPRTWRLWRWLVGEELEKWNYREDRWLKFAIGHRNYNLEFRVWSRYIAHIRERQAEAKKKWEDEQLRENPPPPALSGTPPPEQFAEDEDPEDLIDRRFEVEFMTVDQQKGLPLKTLLSPRRVIERTMQDAKKKVFQDYQQDNIWVRIKVSITPLPQANMRSTARARSGRRV